MKTILSTFLLLAAFTAAQAQTANVNINDATGHTTTTAAQAGPGDTGGPGGGTTGWDDAPYDPAASAGMVLDFAPYPNPSVYYVRLTVPALQGAARLLLVNELGQVWLQQQLSPAAAGQTLSLDVAQLPRGVYHIRLQDGYQVATRKIVLQ